MRTQQRSSKREECACERSRGPGMASWLLRVCFGLVGGRGKQLGETSWRVLASLSSPAASTRLGLERGEAEGRRAWEEQAASTQRKIPRVHAIWCVNTSNWWMRGCEEGLCLLSGGVLACFCSYLILASARVRFLREKRRSGDARNTKKRAWTISDTGNRDMWPEGHACAYLDEKASG